MLGRMDHAVVVGGVSGGVRCEYDGMGGDGEREEMRQREGERVSRGIEYGTVTVAWRLQPQREVERTEI